MRRGRNTLTCSCFNLNDLKPKCFDNASAAHANVVRLLFDGGEDSSKDAFRFVPWAASARAMKSASSAESKSYSSSSWPMSITDGMIVICGSCLDYAYMSRVAEDVDAVES